MSRELLAVFLALSGCLQALHSSGSSATRPVTTESQTASSLNHVSFLLGQAGVWGGIEDYRSDCGPEQVLRLPAIKGTLQDALTQLKAQDASIIWRAEDDGIQVRRNPPAKSILDVKINEFTFDKNSAPDKNTDALLGLPVVKQRIAALDFSIQSAELGFAQARTKSQDILTLRNISLREGLNAIARSPHPRVWLFRQTMCGGQTTLQVQWVVK